MRQRPLRSRQDGRDLRASVRESRHYQGSDFKFHSNAMFAILSKVLTNPGTMPTILDTIYTQSKRLDRNGQVTPETLLK